LTGRDTGFTEQSSLAQTYCDSNWMRNTFLQRKYPQDAVQADPLRKRSFTQLLTEN
jgi:hypothetical protein